MNFLNQLKSQANALRGRRTQQVMDELAKRICSHRRQFV